MRNNYRDIGWDHHVDGENAIITHDYKDIMELQRSMGSLKAVVLAWSSSIHRAMVAFLVNVFLRAFAT